MISTNETIQIVFLSSEYGIGMRTNFEEDRKKETLYNNLDRYKGIAVDFVPKTAWQQEVREVLLRNGLIFITFDSVDNYTAYAAR